MRTIHQSSNHLCRLLFVVVLVTTFAFAQKKPATPAQGKPAQQPTATQAIVLKGGRFLTVSKGVIENGALVIQNGKIAAIGPMASTPIPAQARVIDTMGMTIYPGLIDSESQLGLTEISADEMTNDLREPADNVVPHMRVSDAFHAESEVIPVTRLNGITNAMVVADIRNSLPGQTSFIQLDGGSAADMLLIRDFVLPLNFTGDQRRNGNGRGESRGGFPMTRMGVAAQLRQAFLDAQDYARKWDEYERKKNDPKAAPPKRGLKLEALVPYVQGKKTVVISANEPSDLQAAVRIAQEFGLKFVLNRIAHAQPILDWVASLKVPVIVGPIYELPKDTERYDAVYRLPAELHKRGVKIAFASYDAHNARNLPYQAGYAAAWGLPADEALKAITLNPAEIWGVADRLGSLEVGKTANIVVATGDPLDMKTDVKRLFIAGREVPMVSRQTQLRDQYTK